MKDKKTKSNILIILADQRRQDCLGIYGNRDVKTPHLDQLGSQGDIYENSYCSYPVCTPSRYSLLSGLYSNQHRGLSNHSTLSPDINTFPKDLRWQGYNTCAVGKMHFTPTYLDVGFDKMILAEQNGPGRFDDDYHRELLEKGLYDRNDLQEEVSEFRERAPKEYWETLNAKISNLPDEYHSTSWIGRKATEEIESWSDTGNLLMVGFIKPHHPFDPLDKWASLYSPDNLELLPGWDDSCSLNDLSKNGGFFPHNSWDKRKYRKALSYYYANISHIDNEVGQMVSTLKEKGLYDDTVIIYTSDHGDYMGYHHLLLKSSYMYEPLMKVPLIVKPKGNRISCRKDESLISNVDFSSLLKHLIGDGTSLFDSKRDFIYAIGSNDSEYMIKDKRYKLLLCENDSLSQFFDLEEDSFEKNNLYTDENYAENIKYLKEKLLQWILFGTKTQVFCDEFSKTTTGDNVQKYDRKRREQSLKYFRDKMSENL